MSLPSCLLQWPREVSRQVMSSLFMPAAEMHPAQAREQVPQVLWPLSAAALSRGLDPDPQWPAELDGRRIEHRLCLLPYAVIEQIAWRGGLLLGASRLKRQVLRTDLERLAQNGLSPEDWACILGQDKTSGAAFDEVAAALDQVELEQWPARLKQAGLTALLHLGQNLPPSLGRLLRWKLPPVELSPGSAPPATWLTQAYEGAVLPWSAVWDECLQQLRPHGGAAPA